MKSYIYTFIREDLSPAQKIVQLGHACHEAGKKINQYEDDGVSNLILLSAKDEDELKHISCKISCAGIEHSIFYEPDNHMGYSAICTRPVYSEKEREFFREWKLYRPTV